MKSNTVSPAPFAMTAIFAGAFSLIMFSVAILADGDWTFNVNTLSDLGTSDTKAVADIFNYTCIASGLFSVIFGIGKIFIKTGMSSASGFLIAAGGVFLIGVGIFTKDSLDIHVLMAAMYFILTAIALLVSTIADSKEGNKFGMALGVIAIVIAIGAAVGLQFPGLEVVSVVAICIWMIGQGLTLSRGSYYKSK